MRTICAVAIGVALLTELPTHPLEARSSQSVVFEAASIRQNLSANVGSAVGRQPGGRFAATNATLGELIRYAWQLQDFQIEGGPPWLNSDHWDIVAKMPEGLSLPVPGQIDDLTRAVRALLEERFRLATHREARELPVYAMVRVRSDGRLGPELRPSTLDCAALMASRARGGPPPPPPASGGPPCSLAGRIGSIRAGGVPLSELALALSSRVQRQVVDRTGLTGNWEFALTYAADQAQVGRGVLAAGDQIPQADPNAPSLFTAIQEQLGLKLEPTRGPVDVFVIDRAERPPVN